MAVRLVVKQYRLEVLSDGNEDFCPLNITPCSTLEMSRFSAEYITYFFRVDYQLEEPVNRTLSLLFIPED
jgi:hypothetical protein